MNPNELIFPQDVSVELLKAMFDAAYTHTEIDSDGDLYVKEEIGCYVLPNKNGTFIQLVALFRSQDNSSIDARLAFVNRVNDEMIIVRGYMRKNGGFAFDYYLPIEGGTTKRNAVQSTKFFLPTVTAATKNCDNEDVVK